MRTSDARMLVAIELPEQRPSTSVARVHHLAGAPPGTDVLDLRDEGSLEIVQRVVGALLTRTEPLTMTETARVLAALDDVLPGPEAPGPEDAIGPVYSTTGLTRRLGVSRQALNARVQRHTLLGIPADDGGTVFPAFQFADPDRPTRVLPGIKGVIGALTAAGASAMTVALWCTAPADRLAGATPAAWLREGGEPGVVVALARADAARWSR